MREPIIEAVAKFQKNMVETLQENFDSYAVDGVVQVEVTDHGLWLINPLGGRQFLGATERFPTASQGKMS